MLVSAALPPRSGGSLSDHRRSTPVRFRMPRRISIRATENSIQRPTLGGIARPNRMIAEPTTKIVSECPTPPQHADHGSPADRTLPAGYRGDGNHVVGI